jgi:DNA repair protein SbcC/Rad50
MEKKMNKNKNEKEELEKKINELKEQIVEINNYDEAEAEYKDFKEKEKQYNELKDNINDLTKEKKKLEKKLEKLQEHEFDPKCKYCMKYNVTLDKINYTNELTELNNKLEKLIKDESKKNKKYQKAKKIETEYMNNMEQRDINNKLEYEINIIMNKLNTLIRDIMMEETQLEKIMKSLNVINENENNIESNKKVNIMIEEIREKIMEIKNKDFDKYEKYLVHNKKYNEVKNNLLIGDYEIKNNKLQLETYNTQLKEKNREKESLNYDEDKIKVYEHNKKKFEKLKIKIEKQEKEYTDNYEEIQKMEKEIMELKVKQGIEQNKYKEVMAKLKEIELCEYLVTSLGGDGLVSKILKDSVLPKIEEVANNIMSVIAKFKLKLSLVTSQGGSGHDGVLIEKVCKDGIVLTTQSLSGGELLLSNLALLLSMTHINSTICSNFIILDESFVYSDSHAIDNIQQIFEYINKQYDCVLVISHNNDIIKQFDNSIKVTTDGVYSNVMYT